MINLNKISTLSNKHNKKICYKNYKKNNNNTKLKATPFIVFNSKIFKQKSKIKNTNSLLF